MDNNILVVSAATGASYVMNEDQIEAAYRYQEHQYLIEDAKNQLELNADWIEDRYGYSYDEIIGVAEELGKRFEESCDCNISENETWNAVIEEYFELVNKQDGE